MNVLCIIPVAAYSQNLHPISVLFEKSIGPELYKLGAENIELKFPGAGYTFVGVNQEVEYPAKGEGIIGCIKNVATTPQVVILCDGSNKIPYESIPRVFQELTSDSTLYAVMAKRGDYKAISDSRFLVERFEVFIIKKKLSYGGEIPDGQCGLWAYRTKPFGYGPQSLKIELTAKGYEVELDLLGEVLEKKLSHSFISVNLTPPKEIPKTLFNYDDNLQKIDFLMEKHASLKRNVRNYLTEFERTKEFSELSSKPEVMNDWKTYRSAIFDRFRAFPLFHR